MIKILNQVEKTQENFWNHCVFHPTDAIEDPWGKRILDKISADGAIKTIRIYTMFEDIVYFDGNHQIQFDFYHLELSLQLFHRKGM